MRLPSLGILYAAILHSGVLAVFAFYDRELPKALIYYEPDAAALCAIVLTCLGHGALLATIATILRRWIGKWGFAIFLVVFLLQLVAAVVDVSYYVAYGSYPGVQIWSNLYYSPRAVLGYVRVASSLPETFCFILGLIFACFLGVRLWRDICERVSWMMCLLLALVLHASSYLSFEISRPAGYRFIAREHSLPVVRWYGSILQPPGNSLEEVARIVPPVARSSAARVERSVRNVLVVIVECLRPDHLSLYGYQRKTTPFLESHRDDLVLFRRGYAHAPSTESSFPVIFTGRYLPDKDVPRTSIWRQLQTQGVRTAFVSSGQMRWGYLDSVIALHEAEYLFTAANADSSERVKFSSDPKDYGVDDRIALARYQEFLKGLGPHDSTFSVLHLDASHYPYQEPNEFRKFTPTLGDGDKGRTLGEVRAAITDPLLRERLMNSYDNGIAFADHLIGEVVGSLKALGRLDDTAIVITSDHGEAFGEHDSGFHGTTLFEEQVHVPIIVRLPEHLADIRERVSIQSDSPRGLVDLLPTAFDLLGIENDPGFEGLSWLDEARKPYEVLLYSGFGRKVAIVLGQQKFIFDCLTLEAFHFDLESDPSELKNLWTEDTKTLRGFLEIIFPSGERTKPSP